jgi:hypothetical protein
MYKEKEISLLDKMVPGTLVPFGPGVARMVAFGHRYHLLYYFAKGDSTWVPSTKLVWSGMGQRSCAGMAGAHDNRSGRSVAAALPGWQSAGLGRCGNTVDRATRVAGTCRPARARGNTGTNCRPALQHAWMAVGRDGALCGIATGMAD